MIQCINCGATNRPSARFCTQCGFRLVTATPLPLGTVVQGRYKVLSLLGQGGMGAAYLVEDQKVFGRRWTLKEMLDTFADPADRAQAIQQFETEAKMLVHMSHPNLPQIADYFSEGGRQYLVMEFIDGETLEAILNKTSGFVPESEVLDWAIQLCDVLAYLHSQKPNPIIFRDLKPENIMLSQARTIKLIDFGIARLFDPAKKTDTLKMGTIGYAPPEQYAGHGQTDVRSDIYALGATLHRLLTKHDPSSQPFVFPHPDTINNKVSPNMVRAIMKAVNIDPAQRYRSAQDMKADLLATPSKLHTPPHVRTPKAALIYVTNQEDGTITIIDSATNTIQSALRPGNSDQYPYLGCIAATADGRVCVAQHQDPDAQRQRSQQDYLGALAIFDGNTLKQVQIIPVCKEHRLNDLAIAPDMRAFVTTDEGAYAIDIDKGQVLHHIELKDKLGGIAILPSGRAFIASRDKGHVFVVDTGTYAIMSVVNASNRLGDVAVSQDNTVWVTHLDALKIVAIDGDTNLVKAVIERKLSFSEFLVGPSGFQGLAVAPNGKVYATEKGGRRISVVDPTTNSVAAQVQVGLLPTGIATSDNGMVYVVNSGSNTLSVIDSATDVVVATIGVGRHPYHIAVG